MQRVVRQRVIPIRFSEKDIEVMDEFVGKTGSRSRSEFIREAVKYYLNGVREMKVIRIRNISKGQAKKEILNYLRDKEEAETFDIANDLRLDLSLTMQALKELWEEGSIR